MNQPPQTNRRIVSKGRYIQVLGMRASMEVYGTFLMLLAAASAMAVVGIGLLFLAGVASLAFVQEKTYTLMLLLLALSGAGICSVTARYAWRSGIKILDRSQDLSAIIPLTRANTADLPASDSLVRASAEPLQEQQNVLLRAATETQDRHGEQLLRAGAE